VTYSHLWRAADYFARYLLAMLTLISCRESRVNANQFGPHVITGDQEFFDGGPVDQPIFIHGYNRTEDQVAQDYIALSAALKQDCIAYSWPGGAHPLDFPAAVARANLAGYRLTDVLSMRHLRASSENVVTHSLGARVALTALKAGLFRVKKLILMGATVDWNVFDRGAEFERVATCCESIHVLYSNRDDVLKLAFPLGDFGGDHRALGLDGPREPLDVPENIFLHDVSTFIDKHSAYLSNLQCFELVRQMLMG
jgi:esterase/lipase superfamily enzyme